MAERSLLNEQQKQARRYLNDLSEKTILEMTSPGENFEIRTATVNGVTFRCFKNSCKTLAEFYRAKFAKFAANEFIVYENVRLRFSQVERRALIVAKNLVENFGVRPGDRVAISMRNSPEWCISFIAVTLLGAVCVPLNSWWKTDELHYGVTHSGSKVIICDEDRFKRLVPFLEKLPQLQVILVADSRKSDSGKNKPNHITLYESLFPTNIDNDNNARDYARYYCTTVDTDSTVAIMYTSGTTGYPKGVMITHRGLTSQMFFGEFLEEAQNRLRPIVTAKGIPFPPAPISPCCILPIPLFHVTALHHIFLSSFISGGRLVIMYKWDTAKAIELIEKEKPTAWSGVPTMIQDLIEHPNFSKIDTSSFLRVSAGGAPTPPAIVPKIPLKFKNAAPGNGYGLTETNGAVTWNTGLNYLHKPTSCGRPFPIVEAKLVDPDTKQELKVTAGNRAQVVGELAFKSALVMKGYWDNQEATDKAIVKINGDPGWFLSGDIATIDDEGFVHITDRAKDIIIRGGENISCVEVEGAFYEHSAVMECAVFGLPDERLGEIVAACVMLKPSVSDLKPSPETAQLLVQFVGKRLASFKVPLPQHVYFSKQILPRGGTGKVLKREIRDYYRALLEKQKSKL